MGFCNIVTKNFSHFSVSFPHETYAQIKDLDLNLSGKVNISVFFSGGR